MGNSLKPNITFDSSLLSAFGTLETGELTPVLQSDFVYGLNTQVWNTSSVNGTGASVDTNAGRLRIQSGTGGSGNYAYITTKKIIRYRAGQGTVIRYTPLFTTGVANSLQFWGVGSISSNAPYDGYYFGYSGTTFGIAYYNAGVAKFTPRAQWNGDLADGNNGSQFSWNPTLGSPVMIKYPYLGYGDAMFYVQNPMNATWALVHTIRYANTSTATELSNPSLQFIGFTSSSGSVTNLTMYAGSIGMFISGSRNYVPNPKWAIDVNKATVTSEVPILSLKNCTTYNGIVNRGMIRLNSISFASNNNSVSTLLLKLNATIGGSPSYTPINGTTADNGATITNGNSIASYDVAATTITNPSGTYLYNVTVGQTGNASIDLTPLDIFICPGEILTISGKASASSLLGVSLNWSEDI